MIDFKIPDAMKKFNTPEKEKEFLQKQLFIHEKYDGVKITLVRNDQPFHYDYRKNWIIAYKGNILYPEEFAFIDIEFALTESIGVSQFALVHEQLSMFHYTADEIPMNTEIFVEFIMNKPTITRDYEQKHRLIVLASAQCVYTETLGILKTTHEKLNSDQTTMDYAEALRMQTPLLIFHGIINRGQHTHEHKSLEYIKQLMLMGQSFLGGKREGVVIKLLDGSMYKMIQDDQHDKEVRNNKKNQWRMSEFDEWSYWLWVNEEAKNLVDELTNNPEYLRSNLAFLSHRIYSTYDPDQAQYFHDKKSIRQIEDDIMLTAKTKLIKHLEGNNGVLFCGRFQPVTKAHVEIVRTALEDFDTVTVNIIRSLNRDCQESSENPFSLELIERMWKRVSPHINVQHTRTGNVITMINKAEHNINVVLAGSDRVETYNKQLENSKDVHVEEIERAGLGISATQLREALRKDNYETIYLFMDQIHTNFIEELKEKL